MFIASCALIGLEDDEETTTTDVTSVVTEEDIDTESMASEIF